MPPIYLFEDAGHEDLAPLTYARPAALLRCGAQTLLERAQHVIGRPIAGLLVRPALVDVVRRQVNVPVNPGMSTREGVILVNARSLMLEPWQEPAPDTVGLVDYAVAWAHLSPAIAADIDYARIGEARTLETVLPKLQRHSSKARLIARPWDLLIHQKAALEADFKQLGARCDSPPMPGAHLLAAENMHIAADVKIYPGAVLDATDGPIIIGSGTIIGANAVVTGPASFGPNCVVKPLTSIRAECSFGPHSRLGGEISASIFLGYANKQHDGFLGQTIVGAWANLGAGTTTSNVKHTHGHVRMPINGTDVDSQLQYLGSVIGDHAQLGIGTLLSTGSVVGFSSVVITRRPPKFVPSFAWLTDQGLQHADFAKLEAMAKAQMERRGVDFTPADHELFVQIAGEWANREHTNFE